METLLRQHTPHETTDMVMGLLEPEPDYVTTYQPAYPNQHALREAVHEIHTMQPITTPVRVDALHRRLTALAEGAQTPMVITGRCAEPVGFDVSIDRHTANLTTEWEITLRALGGRALWIPRALGQATKPRSNGPVRLADGTLLYPYLGDAVNGEAEDKRAPDPSRMVGMATQSRDIKERLEEVTGQWVPAAHEALLLPYEHTMIRVDPRTGTLYELSGELPWAGVRTNGPNSGPIDLLTQVENPRAVKIGPNTTPDDIEELTARLNPERIPGRLTFMLRTGPGTADRQAALLNKIKHTAPGSVLLWDTHGITRPGEGGAKIRCVPEMIADVEATARACGKAGLTLHGVHLESIGDNSRLECVDEPDQLPTHAGGVDPQLNPRQLDRVLRGVANSLLQ